MTIDFDRQVAPILAERCLECHSTSEAKGGLDLSLRERAQAGGESGPALVPGDLDASLLWQRVADAEMPPEQLLTVEERETLRSWILRGAPWGTDPIDIYRYSTTRRAGYNWWSLQPVSRPVIPRISDDGWARNPIDRFILSGLHASKLTPSAEADRTMLARRLVFDLHGLPPEPELVQAFAADPMPAAYERLVERLLTAPAYGERWARHWLDVIRFGESQGFERDKLRDHSWRFRDWVVEAFNADLSYQDFVRRQLAGDVLYPDDPSAIVATGFLVAGTYDEVGKNQQSEAMKAVVRQDELEDLIASVGQTFLGLTVNCARCHDHKFDPVRQSEYYQLAAALAGVQHGERNIGVDVGSSDAAPLRAALEAVERRLADIEEPVRARLLTQRQTNVSPLVEPPQPIARWEFDRDLSDSIGTLRGQAHGAATLSGKKLRVDGKTGYVTTEPIPQSLSAKTLEVWLTLDTLLQRGGGAISVQSLDGQVFDAIVFGEREPGQWMAGSNGFVRTQSFGGPEETEADQQLVQVTICWHEDGTIAAYRNGFPYGESYRSDGPVTFSAGQAQLVFGLRHSPPGGNRFLSAMIDRAALYDRALTDAEVAATAGSAAAGISEAQLLAELSPAERDLRQRWKFEAEHLRKQLERAEATLAYAVKPDDITEATHVLIRGNVSTPGDVALPAGIAAVLPEKAEFSLSAKATDAERRTALAKWITDAHNPLFARVVVNRLWQYHFGVGFVSTPSDFGYNGGTPTHPELLDWLAVELIDSGWSLKHLQRLILNSATYRQSSRPRLEALAADSDNRLLWRKSPVRLEAEVIRDALLAVSGELNRAIGGPGYHDFTTYVRNAQFYEPVDAVGPSFHRRSLYRAWVRSGRNQLLDVFDCPDPSTMTPRRAVTTTPLQALSLMNNSFSMRMAKSLANRLQEQCGDDLSAQILLAYELLYSRAPAEAEVSEASAFVGEHGLAALCRVLFNTNEFLYVE